MEQKAAPKRQPLPGERTRALAHAGPLSLAGRPGPCPCPWRLPAAPPVRSASPRPRAPGSVCPRSPAAWVSEVAAQGPISSSPDRHGAPWFLAFAFGGVSPARSGCRCPRTPVLHLRGAWCCVSGNTRRPPGRPWELLGGTKPFVGPDPAFVTGRVPGRLPAVLSQPGLHPGAPSRRGRPRPPGLPTLRQRLGNCPPAGAGPAPSPAPRHLGPWGEGCSVLGALQRATPCCVLSPCALEALGGRGPRPEAPGPPLRWGRLSGSQVLRGLGSWAGVVARGPQGRVGPWPSLWSPRPTHTRAHICPDRHTREHTCAHTEPFWLILTVPTTSSSEGPRPAGQPVPWRLGHRRWAPASPVRARRRRGGRRERLWCGGRGRPCPSPPWRGQSGQRPEACVAGAGVGEVAACGRRPQGHTVPMGPGHRGGGGRGPGS